MINPVIQDNFGHHYQLHTSDEVPQAVSVKPTTFRDPMLTEQFVRRLCTPVGYWQRILLRTDGWGFDPNATPEGRISQCLIQGRLKLYPLKHLDKRLGKNTGKLSFPTLPAEHGQSYQLVPASVLLEKPNATTKTFTNQTDAASFVSSLSLEDDQLENLFAAMDTPPGEGKPNPIKQNKALIQALLDRNVMVLVQQQDATPPPKNTAEPAQGAGTKPVSLGPHEEGDVYNSFSDNHSPTTEDIELARADGARPEQLAAREKVAKAFYESESSLGERRFKQEKKGIDFSKPVEVIEFPPPETMQQYVRNTHQMPGNFFDPLGGQSADSLGISDEGRIHKTFVTPKGKGLTSTSAPILDDFTNSEDPVMCKGGGKQLVVGSDTKKKFKSV